MHGDQKMCEHGGLLISINGKSNGRAVDLVGGACPRWQGQHDATNFLKKLWFAFALKGPNVTLCGDMVWTAKGANSRLETRDGEATWSHGLGVFRVPVPSLEPSLGHDQWHLASARGRT